MEASALRAPAGLSRLALPSALLRLRSDEQLVAAFRAGSDEAFRVIHDRYRARLFAYTRQMLGGSRTDAEDALQDVFLRAYNALRADDRPVVLKAWLYRVAHNRCIDHLRRPTPPASEVFEVSRSPIPDPLAEAERREDLRRLIADVQRLPEQQRSALLMREMEGLSYAELAEALETSIPAVKSLLVRARIGLTEAAEARNTSCVEIRNDLTLSFGKGVRASAMARKHMRECKACADFRKELRSVQTGLSALTPGGSPLALVAKLLGLGAGGGAAAGGSAAAGGGAAVVGGGVVAGTTAKVAAVVCCAAVVGGGAIEINKHAVGQSPTPAPTSERRGDDRPAATAKAATATAAARPARAVTPTVTAGAATARAEKAAAKKSAKPAAATAATLPAEDEAISPHVAEEEPVVISPTAEVDPADSATGGAMAPAEEAQQAAGTGTGTTTPDGTTAAPAGTAPPASEVAPPPPYETAANGTTGATSPTATSAVAPGR